MKGQSAFEYIVLLAGVLVMVVIVAVFLRPIVFGQTENIEQRRGDINDELAKYGPGGGSGTTPTCALKFEGDGDSKTIGSTDSIKIQAICTPADCTGTIWSDAPDYVDITLDPLLATVTPKTASTAGITIITATVDNGASCTALTLTILHVSPTNNKPVIDLAKVTPSMANPGSEINFEVGWHDNDDSDPETVYVCKTDSFDEAECKTTAKVCESTTTGCGPVTAPLDGGIQNYYAVACDVNGCSVEKQIVLTVLPYEAYFAGSTDKIVLDSGKKIKDTSVLSEWGDSQSIFLAQNEFEPFQLVIKNTGATALTNIMVKVTPLTGAIGEVFLEYFHQLPAEGPNEFNDGTPGEYWPDALPKLTNGVAIPTNEQAVFWIRFHAATETPATTYSYALEVTGIKDGAAISNNLPVQVDVKGFALPKTPSLKAALVLTESRIASGYSPGTAVRDNFVDVLLDHRISPVFYFYDISSNPKKSKWFESGGVVASNWMLPFSHASTSWYPETTAEGIITNLWNAYSLGITDAGKRLYLHIFDEPNNQSAYSFTATRAVWTAGAAPQLNVFVTEQKTDQGRVTGPSSCQASFSCPVFLAPPNGDPIKNVNEWASLPAWFKGVDEGYANSLHRTVQQYYATDPIGDPWWYNVDTQTSCGLGGGLDAYRATFGSSVIDYIGPRNRVVAWEAFKHEIKGLFYWEGTYFKNMLGESAWDNPHLYASLPGCGNGWAFLFYPGNEVTVKTGGQADSVDYPVTSIRLELWRESMEDYEYLRCDGKSPTDMPLVINYNYDPIATPAQKFYDARRNMADSIVMKGITNC